MYLSILRSHTKKLNFTEKELSYYKRGFIYNQLKDTFSLVFNEIAISSNEVAFLVAIYSILPLNTNSYLTLEMHYEKEREFIIENRPFVKQLIYKLENEFNVSLYNNILFEKPFMNFLCSLWRNMKNFIYNKHYYLDSVQIDVFYKIKDILIDWKNNLQTPYTVEINDTSVEKLCSQIYFSLLQSENKHFICFIVADDSLSHIIYRESIQKWLNKEYINIDSTMYYDLEELPSYISEWPHVIICDRSLIYDNSYSEHRYFFPISKPTIDEDIANILSYIYVSIIQKQVNRSNL